MMSTDETVSIPIVTETATIGTRAVETGRVRVDITTDTHTDLIPVELREGVVTVDRIAVGQYVDAPPTVRVEGDVTVIPVLEEHPIVTVRLFLREEVRIRTESLARIEHQAVVLRAERVSVTRDDAAPHNNQEESSTHG